DSSKKEQTAAQKAEEAAVEAESAYADAKAKADAEAAAQGANAAEESSDTSGEQAADPNASRTGFADKGLKAGELCTCPDGRPGTVARFDVGLVCLPNQG